MFAPLLEVEMLKKCTRLWRKAHFDVNMYKTRHVRATFGRSDVVSRGRRKGFCTLSKVSKREGFVAFSNTTTTTPRYTPIDYTTTTSSLHSTSVRYTTLHYSPLRYTQLRSITLNYTQLHYTSLHYIPLHYTTTLHYNITLHYIPLHYSDNYNY